MKDFELPPIFFEFHYPWNICSREQRNEILKTNILTQEAIESALDTFSKGVVFMSIHVKPNITIIPDDEIENWEYSNELISEKISSYSEMNMKIIEDFSESMSYVHKSEELVEEILNYWIWFTVFSLVDDSSRFLKKYIENNEDPRIAKKFINIFSHNWRNLSFGLIRNLIGKVYAAGERAIPVLNEIQNECTDGLTRNIASQYKSLVNETAHLV
jgi:hypothetical protein